MSSNSTAVLKITDGTFSVNLVGDPNYFLSVWRPAIAAYKGGGVYQDSSLADGRSLVFKRFENAIETIELHVASKNSQDSVINYIRILRNLLEKASTYWASNAQAEMVWLEAKASKETNTRYAIVHAGQIAEDGNPYATPFLQPGCAAVLDDLTLVIERGHWTNTRPGVGTAVELAARESYFRDTSFALEFDGFNSLMDVGSDVGFDNLFTSANGFTVEAWVNPDGLGGVQRLFDKALWWLSIYDEFISGVSYPNALVATMFFQTPAFSVVAFPDDGEWHHVAMTYRNIAPRRARIWIDGVEPDYLFQQSSAGSAFGDSDYNMKLGGTSYDHQSFDGLMGWARISNTRRYTADFTPPDRCDLPISDGTTVALYLMEEGTGTVVDNAEGTAARDGTLLNSVTWQLACLNSEVIYGNVDENYLRDPTTQPREVFVVNKRTTANLSHAYSVDQDVQFSPNGIQDTSAPYVSFPLFYNSPPLAGDSTYFGIEQTGEDDGPFSNLVLNLEIENEPGDFTAEWQYFDGAVWVVIPQIDDLTVGGNGSPVMRSGVSALSFLQPDDWAPVTLIPGVTGYFIRLRITGSGTAATQATQIIRNVYSVTWPYTEIQADQIPGDIPAKSRIQLHPYVRGATDDEGDDFARLIVGLRSTSRGESFTPVINMTHLTKQNPPGVWIRPTSIAETADITKPTGFKLTDVRPPGDTDWDQLIVINFDSSISGSYYGKFRAILRGYQEDGIGITNGLSLKLAVLTSGPGGLTTVWETDVRQFAGNDDWAIVDFGELNMPDFQALASERYKGITILLYAMNTSPINTITSHYYDLWLMPSDEWTGDFLVSLANNFSVYMDVDSIGNPKIHIRAYIKEGELLAAVARTVAAGEAIFQANIRQRVYFMLTTKTSITNMEVSYPETVSWVAAQEQSRYLSARGNN